MENEVAEVEIAGGRELFSKECRGHGWVVGDFLDDCSCGRSECRYKEDLYDLEHKVSVLNSQFDGARGWVATKSSHPAKEDGKKSHEYGEQDHWKEAGDNSKNLGWDFQNKAELGNETFGTDKRVDVGDGPDQGNRDGPEDDQNNTGGHGQE